MRTLAAILIEQHKPLEIGEVEIPPIRFGQVLVDIHVSRICGSQIGEIDGVKGPDRFLPHLLGHEGGADVLEVGEGVTTVKAGDRVVMHWRPGDGLRSEPPRYSWDGRTVNAGYVTTFNHLAIASEDRVTAVPPDTDPEVCALMADTITTGFGVINNDADVRIGESVVIIGCGGIGLGAVLGAHLAGAHPIVAVDVADDKLVAALAHGATHAVRSDGDGFIEHVRSVLGGLCADVVVDGTGSPRVIESAYELTGPRGRCVLYGVMHHSEQVSIHTLPLHHGKKLTGSEGGSSEPARDIPRYLRMIEDGRFDLSGFVSHRGRLEDVNDLIAKMRSGEVLHSMMHFKT